MAVRELTLYSYYQSSAAWRVRSVLAHKKVPFKYEAINLIDGQQHGDEFVRKSPMHQAPAVKVELEDGTNFTLTQSLAIIDYLESIYPENPILPKDPILRAKARAIADTISSGIQPLQNHETLVKYGEPLGMSELEPNYRKKIAQFWIARKLVNLEKLVQLTAGKYCVGDEVTLADVCLVPQMYNARRFEVDTGDFPLLKDIDARLQQLEMFKVSHPNACPDTPAELRPARDCCCRK